MQGFVKFLDEERGCGFIRAHDLGTNVFFHRTAIVRDRAVEVIRH